MSRPDLGTKRTCSGFNDRSALICPKCGIRWSPETPRASHPPDGAFTSRFQTRQRRTVVVTDDDVEPANTFEDEDDLHEHRDDETEADIEIAPDLPDRQLKFRE